MLVAETYDETPLAVPRPWHDLPVMPALVRWRLLDSGGRVALGWSTAVDFRLDDPARVRVRRPVGSGNDPEPRPRARSLHGRPRARARRPRRPVRGRGRRARHTRQRIGAAMPARLERVLSAVVNPAVMLRARRHARSSWKRSTATSRRSISSAPRAASRRGDPSSMRRPPADRPLRRGGRPDIHLR